MKTREAPQVPRPTFLGGSKGLWIGGKWLPAASGEEFDTYNPADGTVIARLARGSDVDVDRAVTAARAAFEGEWSRWTPYQRQRLLLRINDVMEQHAEELAILETMDMGAPLTRTRAGIKWISQAISFFASCATAVTKPGAARSWKSYARC